MRGRHERVEFIATSKLAHVVMNVSLLQRSAHVYGLPVVSSTYVVRFTCLRTLLVLWWTANSGMDDIYLSVTHQGAILYSYVVRSRTMYVATT